MARRKNGGTPGSKTQVRMYKAENKLFETACILADTRGTYRQYRKWEQGRGAAFAKKGEAAESLKPKAAE